MATETHIAPEALPGLRALEPESEKALVPSSADLVDGSDLCAPNSPFARIPIEIDVTVPVRGFRVRDLMVLAKDDVIESQWLESEDMPLGARGAQLAWAEFEVIDERLAVRITRLT